MSLLIPQPQLLNEQGETPSEFGAEQVIQLVCEPVTFLDGTSLTLGNTTESSFLLYRRDSGGDTAIWQETEKYWTSDLDAPVEPQPLFYREDKWQALIVAIGQKDRLGQNKLETIGGSPQYYVRCFFRGWDSQGIEHAGESPDSAAISVHPYGEQHRAGLRIEPFNPDYMELDRATEIRMFLKYVAFGPEIGRVAIRRSEGGAEVELVANDAKVTITSNGDIKLEPASGRAVYVNGDLRIVDGYIYGVVRYP